jgi:hypothetical protein
LRACGTDSTEGPERLHAAARMSPPYMANRR